MSNVIRFPTRLRPIQPITAEQVDIRNALIVTLGTQCRQCSDRGVIFFQTAFGPSYRPCPCGGTDEDRIDLNDFDFGGAA